MVKCGIKLGEHDVVVTAWAEHCQGPGWANFPICVLIRDRWDGKLRIEYIQPEHQTKELNMLHQFTRIPTSYLVREVEKALER